MDIAHQASTILDFPLSTVSQSFDGAFPLSISQNPLNASLFHAQLSNNSIFTFSIGESTIRPESVLEQAHEKRINEIFIEENVLYSCSNDATVKLWDLNTNKLIKAFKKNPEEIYSISKSKHILAGGSSGKIFFWDLKVMKERFTFADSHDDDVTKVVFHPDYATLLLSGSLDGILCLFDLAKENEEDSIETMIRHTQPIDSCGFGDNKDWAYMVTTVGTVSLVNLPESTVVFSINGIENNENNQNYLIEVEKRGSNQGLVYYRGNHNGFVEEFELLQNPFLLSRFSFSDTKYVRCCKSLDSNHKLIGTEDGFLSIVKTELPFSKDGGDLTEKDIFIEEEKSESIQESNKQKKRFKNEMSINQNHFDPLRK